MSDRDCIPVSIERYPGIESGFLIVKEDGQLNYAEINFFAMEFVPTLLDLAADDILDSCPKVSQANLDQLKKLGALGDLPDHRQVSLFDLDEESEG